MTISYRNQPTTYLALICAALLFLAAFNLPIQFYFLLRIVTTVGAISMAIIFRKDFFRLMVFLLIGFLFNPIYPVYLQGKSVWVPIDIICAMIFLLATVDFSMIRESKISNPVEKPKDYTRDKIY